MSCVVHVLYMCSTCAVHVLYRCCTVHVHVYTCFYTIASFIFISFYFSAVANHGCGLFSFWKVSSHSKCVASFNCFVTLSFLPSLPLSLPLPLSLSAQDGTITLWDLGMSRIDWEVKAHTKSVTSLAYSCDGTLLASTSEDMTIKLWNMKAVLVNTAR